LKVSKIKKRSMIGKVTIPIMLLFFIFETFNGERLTLTIVINLS